MTANPRVVIVGAGTSGLAAAWTLIRNGVTQVTVLEAQDRTGGRIHTIDFGSRKIDMGAQFIHGQGNNPVYKLARKYDLVADYAGGISQMNLHFNFSSGQQACTKTTNAMVRSMLIRMLFKRALSTIGWKSDFSSFGDYAEDVFNSSIVNKSDTKEVASTKKAMLECFHNLQKAENTCDTWQQVSYSGFVDEAFFGGDEYGGLKRGYHSLLDVLLNDIPADCIRLKQPVVKIHWNDTSATVSTANDNFEADHVIVTTSVGYLKKKHGDIFDPSIGERKIAAVNDIGYGTLGKIFLEFDEPFWEIRQKTVWVLCLLWRDEDDLLELLDVAEDMEPWYRSIMCFMAVPHIPGTLLAMVGGRDGAMMESRPPEEVGRVCHQLLQKFLGKADIPRPNNIKMSRWHDNEYFFGSYSFTKVPRGPEIYEELAEPLPSRQNPRLQFAGEATQREHHSTVHGALISGEREAQRILAQYGIEVKDALWKKPSSWNCAVM